MQRDPRVRDDVHVEFIDTDPAAFGALRPSTPSPSRMPTVALVLFVGVVALLGVVWWQGGGDPAATVPTTTVGTTTTVALTAPSGRVAPGVNSDLGFTLEVRPSVVSPGSTASMQLTGDLSTVAERVAAVAWLDRSVDGGWRTVYWLALAPSSQRVQAVSGDRAEPGPDAISVAADSAVAFSFDEIAGGEYRLCRYVPMRPDPVAGGSVAYVCAPLTVTR